MQWTVEKILSNTDTNARSDGSSDIQQNARAMVLRTSVSWQSTVDSQSPMLSGARQPSNGAVEIGESMGDGSNAN